MIKNVKIDYLTYDVFTNKYIENEYWGRIYYDMLEIRLQRFADGREVKEIHLYKTLLHEIIHGIDEIVKFVVSDKEDAIDLISLYILQNINILQNCKVDHFENYLDEYEIEIKRKKVVFNMIVKMLNDNEELTKKLKEIFKNGEI